MNRGHFLVTHIFGLVFWIFFEVLNLDEFFDQSEIFLLALWLTVLILLVVLETETRMDRKDVEF